MGIYEVFDFAFTQNACKEAFYCIVFFVGVGMVWLPFVFTTTAFSYPKEILKCYTTSAPNSCPNRVQSAQLTMVKPKAPVLCYHY